jgi:hypothetical protein
MNRVVFALLLLTADVRLIWDASVDAAGYEIYRTESSGDYPATPLNSVLISETAFTDTTAVPGSTYFYIARAVSDNGLKSPPSNEVFAVVTLPPTMVIALPSGIFVERGKTTVLLEVTNAARIELRIDGKIVATAANATRLSYRWNANRRGLHTISGMAIGLGWETEVTKTVTVR